MEHQQKLSRPHVYAKYTCNIEGPELKASKYETLQNVNKMTNF